MYQQKIVTQVKRRQKRMAGVLRVTMLFFGIVFVLMAIVVSRGFMLSGFLLVGLYFVFDIFSRKSYEYLLEGETLCITVFLGGRYRREAHELDLGKLEVLAPSWHESVAQYRKDGGSIRLRKYDYTSYEEDVPYYTMIIFENGTKIKLLLDLEREMLLAIKKQHPQKVFFE